MIMPLPRFSPTKLGWGGSKKKARLSCRAFPPYRTIPPSKTFARISLASKLVKRGGTGATKWP